MEVLAASFLYVVDKEGQHHQGGGHGGKVLLAMTVIMFEVVTEVFEGVKGFVLHLPAGTACTYHIRHIVGGEGDVSHAVIDKGCTVGAFLPIVDVCLLYTSRCV